jgi:hypothetical protein
LVLLTSFNQLWQVKSLIPFWTIEKIIKVAQIFKPGGFDHRYQDKIVLFNFFAKGLAICF